MKKNEKKTLGKYIGIASGAIALLSIFLPFAALKGSSFIALTMEFDDVTGITLLHKMVIPVLLIALLMVSCILVIVSQFKNCKKLSLIGCAGMFLILLYVSIMLFTVMSFGIGYFLLLLAFIGSVAATFMA